MAHEGDSVLHSWCVQSEWRAPTVVGGSGAFLELADGRRILDMSSLAECSNLGHQHPAVVEAIRRQAEQLCFVTSAWGAEPRAALATALLEKAGYEGGRVFFTLAGADANENALKFARQASRKPRGHIITRDRSYHGASYACMALSGDARTRDQVDPQALGVLHVPPPYAYQGAFGSHDGAICGERAVVAIAETIDRLGADTVAAVMMEPNAGTNGIVAPDNYWPNLRQATRSRGVYLIADEVMSGFGRCGEWFAWQRYGDIGKPDLMTLAKGLTGAHLPLGAVVLSAEIAARLQHDMLYTGLTYCGHPLSCAAGLAALQAYEDEDLIVRSRTLGARMFAELKTMQSRHPVIGDVRGGHGLFAVIELVADRVTREPLTAWPTMPAELNAMLETAMAEGVSFACRGNLILLAPPLVIDEHALADALALLDRLLTRFFPAQA
ncbi:aspartate aminotransferase family protein [Dyella halodurans]|uniref:Aspartate aminotransferase family protein n=1 Tax=Dyella halodurans TaxID=1920171 RepID=A0ABV9C261_9GAMM|nr:aspartate aminotransferase family protein [Dyella halodurans]